ncbi:hypothetical protein [Sphingobium sp. TCM1]|uniref:hypothetical protein n=1 Tax=Sphingobium sp. TCM1 TaxID=453246 RepID=UPI001E4C74BD|nr:hypothetical protein [Sphingobium sp. TCM1]
MVATVAAAFQVDALPRCRRELAEHHGCDRLLGRALQQRRCALGIRPCLVPGRLQPIDAILQSRVVKIGDSALDGVVESLQAQLGLGSALVQLGDMVAASVGSVLSAIQDCR